MATVIAGVIRTVLDADSRNFERKMRRSARDVRTFKGTVDRASNALVTFRRVATFAAVFGAGALAKKVVMAGEEMLSFERRLSVLSNSVFKQTKQFEKLGSAQAAFSQELAFLRGTALRTGQNFDTLGKAYIRMVPMAAAAGISIQTVKNALIGTIGAGVVMGATNLEMRRAFIALGQVIGKGVLQMEELRQQLGEAMPNAMIIAADGLTKLQRQTGEIGPTARISIGQMVKMIQQGQFTAEKFIRAWDLGTESFRQFAEVGAFTVTGQLENLRTVLITGIGGFMLRSGLQSAIISTFTVLNKQIDMFLQNMTEAESREFGNKIINGIERIIGFFKTLGGVILPIIESIGRIGSVIIETLDRIFANVPAEVIDIGIIGLLFLGKKGKLLVGALLAASAVFPKIAEKAEEAAAQIENAFIDIPKNLKDLEFVRDDKFSEVANQARKLRLARAKEALAEVKSIFLAGNANKFIDADARERIRIINERGKELEKLLFEQRLRLQRLTRRRDTRRTLEAVLDGGSLNRRIKDAKTTIAGLQVAIKISEKVSSSIAETLMKIGEKARFEAEASRVQLQIAGEKIKTGTKGLFDQIKEGALKVDEVNRLIKEKIFGFTPTKGSILDQLPVSEINRLFRKYVFAVDKFKRTDTPAGIVNAKLNKELILLAQNSKKLEGLLAAGAFEGNINRISDIAQSFIRKAALDVANLKTADTVAELTEDFNARLSLLKEFIFKLVVVGKLGFDAAADLGAKLEAKLRLRFDKFKTQIGKRGAAAALEPLNKALNRAKSAFEAQEKALDAIVTKAFQASVFERERRIEVLKIKQGEISSAAAVFSVTDQKRMQLAIAGEIRKAGEENLRNELQLKLLSDAQVKNAMTSLEVSKLRLSNKEQELATERLGDPRIRAQLLNQEILALREERKNIGLKREQLRSGALQKENLDTEILKLRLEQDTIRMRALQLKDPNLQKELLNLELQNLRFERDNLVLKLSQANNPAIAGAQTEVDILNARIQLTNQLRLASLSLSDTIQLNLSNAFNSFTNTISQGIQDLIFGAKSLGDVFKGVVKSMITGIIKFFVEWAVKRAAAFVLEQVFGVGVVGIASATQGTIIGISAGTAAALAGIGAASAAAMTATMSAAGAAVAAAWLPAATVVSIATFGGAAAAGTAALGISFGAATGLFAAFKAATSVLGAVPSLHEGGLVGRGNRTGGASFTDLLSDESLAVLQRGELVVPKDFVPSTIAALQSGSNLFDGAAPATSRISTNNITDEDIDDMSQKKVDIVNVFSFEQVERHLQRNPEAIVNIMSEDNRNNGQSRSLRRR